MPPAATTSQQALANLQSFQQGVKDPAATLQGAQSALGVPAAGQAVQGLRGAIQNTTNLLSRVAPSVMGRTQNSLVTDAQATRQIGNEQAPLNTALGQQNQAYGNASQDYQNLLSQAGQQATLTTQGNQNQQSYLEQVYQNLAQAEQQQAAQEQQKAALAEQQREFNLTPHGSASSGALDLSGLLGLASGSVNQTAAAPPPLTKGTSNQDALKQLFTGYNPNADKNYTEQVVLPALANLLALNNPKQPADVIQGAAANLAYNYRKQNFGE